MAWERDEQGHFTAPQKKKIVAMYQKGWTATQIAEKVGCSTNSVSNIAKLAGVYVAARGPNKGKKQPGPAEVETKEQGEGEKKARRTKKDEQLDYTNWALDGFLNGWVDRLLLDLKRGTFKKRRK
jgi:hypothetical protein